MIKMKRGFYRVMTVITFPSHCFGVLADLMIDHFEEAMLWVMAAFWIVLGIGFARTMHPFSGGWPFVGWLFGTFIFGAIIGYFLSLPYWMFYFIFHFLGCFDGLYRHCSDWLWKDKAAREKAQKQTESYEKSFKKVFQTNKRTVDYNTATALPPISIDGLIAQHKDNTSCQVRFR